MSHRIAFTAAALAIGAAGLSFGQETKKLKVGDDAPKIDVAHWLKGDKVTEFEEGKVYVVEFWATWCGPCKASMPHISALQEDYKDYKVQFIGISDEKLEIVEPFLAKPEWDEKTQYTLATDPDRSVYTDYMKAAGQNGIPTAFVVGKEGKIEWIGHPMKIDAVIDRIAHDKWDRDAYAVEEAARAKAEAAVNEGMEMLFDEATAKEGLAKIKEGIEAFWDDSMMLNTIAWEITTNEDVKLRDNDFCQKVAERACELTKHESGMILDTLARVWYEKGDLKKALELQRKAVQHAEEQFADQLKETLEQYEKEAKDKGGV